MMSSSSINLILLSSLFAIISSTNLEQTFLRGVPTTLLPKYVSSKPFVCLDGALTIPFEFVNDDYCDCRDGSDEPGTSACPNGRFFCENKGYIGTIIPSHFVGDSICDCCDGSDEYETRIVCNNTCFELAQKTHAEREAKRALHEAGVAKKREIISKSAMIQSDRQARLDDLERDLTKVEVELREKEELKRQAEIPENEAKDKHNKLSEEQRAIREALAHDQQIREMFADLDTNQDLVVSIEELQKHTELDTDRENDFTIEEVRSILGADVVNFDEFNATVFEQISNSYQKISEILPSSTEMPSPPPPPPPENELSSTTTPDNHDEHEHEHEGEGEEEEDFDHPDPPPHLPPATSLEHEKHIHDETAPEYDEETKQLIQQADHARNEYNDVDRKVHDIRRQRDDLKKQAEVDVGTHGEYSAFIDQCYDYEERDYTYRLCMFKDAKQISKGGGSDVNIGYWDSWTGAENNKYSKMKYGNGATCWNGPARSLTVTFRCGIEHRPVDVREPTRCEYVMIFETPSACDETIAISSFHSDHDEL